MKRETIFSPDRKYRYTLWRSWPIEDLLGFESSAETSAHKFVQFIGLNPSTADETRDDPTVRRCCGFAKAWGFGAICMTNLFAFRATDPQVMLAEPFPHGAVNNTRLLEIGSGAGLIVAAWGTHGAHLDCGSFVRKMFFDCGLKLHHLGLNGDGSPKHPLYLASGTQRLPLVRGPGRPPQRPAGR